MGSIGGGELLLIFLVILLVFGAKRIPEIARGLGRGIREFKEATRDIQRELTLEDPPSRAQHSRARQEAVPHSPPSMATPSSPAEHEAAEHRDEGAVLPVSASEMENPAKPKADL